MELSKQVCNLEQAKRLNILLGDVDSQFFWAVSHTLEGDVIELAMPHNKGMYVPDMLGIGEGGTSSCDESYPAFTVAELGVMLPDDIEPNGGINWSWYHRKCWKGHSVGYNAYGLKSIEQEWFVTEAESRAAMLIHLLETGKITADEVNKRLVA